MSLLFQPIRARRSFVFFAVRKEDLVAAVHQKRCDRLIQFESKFVGCRRDADIERNIVGIDVVDVAFPFLDPVEERRTERSFFVVFLNFDDIADVCRRHDTGVGQDQLQRRAEHNQQDDPAENADKNSVSQTIHPMPFQISCAKLSIRITLHNISLSV